ncbi:zinc ABC transporter substrate-binding protein [Providencia sp. Me31A]|uniref:zinc ABC transporter substrate-binding protein n=1 Tax=Providencia sp. Me31A TaxID=3392637 RepID=UPI003D27EE56
MTKNEIYIEMLFWILPHIRNMQTQDKKCRLKDKSCYYESELIHNLPNKLLIDEFTSSDLSFLNHQARYYHDECNSTISILYNNNLELIRKLFELVPEDLRPQLKWNGPSN